MRIERQNAILRLINDYDIVTQTELSDRLKEMGYEVTQATVSRDIKELRLIKTMGKNGQYKYIKAGVPSQYDQDGRLTLIFSRSVVSIDYAKNIVVVKTLPGMGQAAASTLDSMDSPEIVGTIAGDDTVFVAVRSDQATVKLVQKLRDLVDHT